MHAKPDLRVVLKWTIAGSGSVIADVILFRAFRVPPLMKFNLSTLLLLIFVIALSLGWVIDHDAMRQRQYYLSWGTKIANSTGTLLGVERYGQSLPNSKAWQADVINSVAAVHAHSEEIDEAHDRLGSSIAEPAYVLVKQAMEQLGCNSADAFFLLMRDNPDAYGKEWYLKESTDEHKNLRKFITSALSKPYPFRGGLSSDAGAPKQGP